MHAIRGYTISVRTLRGRLIVHIDASALVQLGASGEDHEDLLRTLNRHMPRLHALALQLAAQGLKTEVTIGAADVAWTSTDGAQSALGHAQAL